MNTNNELEKEKMKITIDSELLEALTPNTYIASLGITKEQREENIIQLACAVLSPVDIANNLKTQIPFMIIKGPVIKEEFLTVCVNCETENGISTVNLSLVKEPEETDLTEAS